MHFLRRHSYGIPLALVLLAFPMQAFAQTIDLSTIWNGFNRGLQEAAYFIVINGLGLLVWFGALLLDFAVNHFVIGFGDTFINSGIGLAVNQTWIIIRDFVNMGFIFGFVYIGFKMILNSADSNTRRWLVNILLAALLVNFSLFITKFAIDFSNQLASQIAVNGLGSTGAWDSETGLYEVNLTSEFMSRMGISSIMGISFGTVAGGGWGYVIGTAILFLTAAFVFAAGGILLIIRFAVLNLFMMLSPLMFLSWVLPPVKDTMQRFWSAFFGRALYAPIYLLFIYFSLQIIAGLQISVAGEGSDFANPNWAGAFQSVDKISGTGNAAGTLGTLPFFILICIFLAYSVSLADKLGADGGTMAVKYGNSFKNKVRRTAVSQTAGRALRGAGSLASGAEGRLNERLGRMAQGGATSRAAARFLDRTAGAGLRNAQNASAGGSESYSGRNARVNQQQARLNQQQQSDTRATGFAGARASFAGAATRDERRAANNDIGRNVRGMSNDEILGMIGSDRSLLQSPEFVRHLTDAHMTAIGSSGILTNAEFTTLRTLRNGSTISSNDDVFGAADAGTDELNQAYREQGQNIRNMSPERKATLTADQLSEPNVAIHLTDRDIEQLEQSGRFTAAQISQIRQAREAAILSIADGSTTIGNGSAIGGAQAGFLAEQRRNMMSNTLQAGQLPARVFAQDDMAEYITTQALEQRIRNGLTDPEADAIRITLERYISNLPYGDPAKRVWEDWDNRSVNAARIDLDPQIF